jgi:hypothetical protein
MLFFLIAKATIVIIIRSVGRIIHDGNSGTEGEEVGLVVVDSVGVGDSVGVKLGEVVPIMVKKTVWLSK